VFERCFISLANHLLVGARQLISKSDTLIICIWCSLLTDVDIEIVSAEKFILIEMK